MPTLLARMAGLYAALTHLPLLIDVPKLFLELLL